MMLLIESGLVGLTLVLAFCVPGFGSSLFIRVERKLAWLARRRGWAVFTVAATALGLRLAFLPILPIPQPNVHDEFSYLLMADTFAHGRLTNPTHPMWRHFETFHEIQKPTYASMYYPAQGAFLAFGQVVLGHPYWGVWLSAGMMCAAICWMLQGWLPPFWALIGGLLAAIRLGSISYWANSYWGGAVAALGGALVLGALPRIRRAARVRDAVLMGIGFALVANSRPYEGLFFSIPVFATLIVWIFRSTKSKQTVLVRAFAPLAAVLTATIAGMGYYFWRITGNPLRTPFFVNISTYCPVPYFPWQSMKAIPQYRYAEMRNFYLGWWMPIYEFGRQHPGVALLLKFWNFVGFYFGPLFVALFLLAIFTVPYGTSFREFSRRAQFMLLVCGAVLVGAALPVNFNSHYAAAISAALYALILMAMIRLRKWKPFGRPTGLAFVRWMCAIALVLLPVRAMMPGNGTDTNTNFPTWFSPAVYRTWRSEISKQLLGIPGKHLVIVHYNPDHPPINEWVFNNADIDHSKIVWAREMGAADNLELIEYFRNRKVWLIDPDNLPPTLSLYAGATGNESSTNSLPVSAQREVH